MRSLPAVKELIKTYKIRPRKERGQNFLIDEGIMEDIVEAARIKVQDMVLEIGAGLGIFTEKLAQKAGKVFAVEIDGRLSSILRSRFLDDKRVEVIEADILKIDWSRFVVEGKIRVVANIPYYITKPIIERITESRNLIEDAHLLLQKEVAERICTDKGRAAGPISIFVNLWMDTRLLFYVQKDCFFPPPSVHSALVHLKPRKEFSKIENESLFSRLVKVCFAQRRKMLKNALLPLLSSKEKVEEVLKGAGIFPSCRAEELGVEGFLSLFEQISLMGGKR
jgi:16S rRNA (adenine1518-N6/adenine1519-N6)-dimethyltransferase